MVCGCPNCGALMIQEVKGVHSRCVCKDCGYSCDACLGTATMIQKGEGLPIDLLLKYQNGVPLDLEEEDQRDLQQDAGEKDEMWNR